MTAFRAAAAMLLLALIALAPLVSAQEAADAAAYRVIVNPNNPSSGVSRTFLQDAFLKRTSRWEHDVAIRPADLIARSPVRAKFSGEVMRRSVAAIKAYWQQRIFSGRDIPPPELKTDEEVVAYVLQHPGALGYVSTKASLKGTKVLNVR